MTTEQKWIKPSKFDRNVVVIGAGAGGLVSSYISAAVNAKVTLIEKHKMGGDCLNTGCVPSKALLRSAKALKEIKKSAELGINAADVSVDFSQVMKRVHDVISEVEPHDSVERYTNLGVECLQGQAKILSPWEVQVNDQILTTRNIIISTGARPLIPDIEGIDKIHYETSDTIWNLTSLPKKMVILGAGPIGCELAQSFALFGSDVTLVELAEQVLIREDTDVGKLVKEELESSGVTVLTGTKAIRFTDANTVLTLTNSGEELSITFDSILFSLGRVPNIHGFGIKELDITLTPEGRIKVNDYLQTNYPNIFAVGDVTGPYQLTHAAGHQAWYAAVNALFGDIKKFKTDYRVLPAVTYTMPEIARVGLNEKEADKLGIQVDVTKYMLDDLDRAIADSETKGFVKVITPKGKDKILGATIVGQHGGEMLAEFTLAMKYGLGLNKILSTIHPYPTYNEANKFTAGIWRKKNTPQKILSLLRIFHRWKRKK